MVSQYWSHALITIIPWRIPWCGDALEQDVLGFSMYNYTSPVLVLDWDGYIVVKDDWRCLVSNVLHFSSVVSTTKVARLGRKELTSRGFICQCYVGKFGDLGGRIAKQSLQLPISIELSVVVALHRQVRHIHMLPFVRRWNGSGVKWLKNLVWSTVLSQASFTTKQNIFNETRIHVSFDLFFH